MAILATGAGPPHAIPVSTGVRAGPRRVLLALANSRESLARLREQPRVALAIVCDHDVAVTAYGMATVVEEPLRGCDGVVAIGVDVDDIQDHNRPFFRIDAGVRWQWTDADAEARDRQVRAALSDLASAG